jgi:hypothetical protein
MRKRFNKQINFIPATLNKKLIIGLFCGTLAVLLLSSHLGMRSLEGRARGGKDSSSAINNNGDVPLGLETLEQDDPKLLEYIKMRHMTPPSKKPYNLIGYNEDLPYSLADSGYTYYTPSNMTEYMKTRHLKPPATSKKPFTRIGYYKTDPGYTGRTAQNKFVLEFMKRKVKKTDFKNVKAKLCCLYVSFDLQETDDTVSLLSFRFLSINTAINEI